MTAFRRRGHFAAAVEMDDLSKPQTNATRITLSNILTIARLTIAPLVFAAAAYGPRSLSLPLYALGLLTDFVDGKWARRTNTTSGFGRAMDSTADKALVGGAMMGLMTNGLLASPIVYSFFLREFVVFGLRAIRTVEGEAVAAISDALGRTRFLLMHAGVMTIMISNGKSPGHVAGIATLIGAVGLAYLTLGFYLARDRIIIRGALASDKENSRR